MKVIITICLYLFMGTALNAQGLVGSSWKEALETKKGTIKVLYYPEDAFAFVDKNGNATGVELDIFKQFTSWVKNAKGIDLKIEWIKEPDFEKLYSTVQSSYNGVFGAANITITEERKKEVKFSDPYINNIAVLITNQNAPDITTMNDASSVYANFNAVVHKGTTHVDRIRGMKMNYLPKLKITEVDSDAEAIAEVVNSNTTFTYTDLANYWIATKENKPVKRQPAGDQSSEEFGYIMPLNSDWGPIFSEFFNLGSGYRSNVMYKRILMRHLGTEVTKMLEMARKN